MTAPSHRSIARALALLALIACQGPSARSTLSNDAIDYAGGVATTTVGMWGNDDGWSLVEPLRLGAIDPGAPAWTGERRCPRAEARPRVQPLDARLEKVSGTISDGGPRRG
ncbi:MAG TPA: hypothetical protein VFZ18_13785 [Longimicrobiaceae bacterium]